MLPSCVITIILSDALITDLLSRMWLLAGRPQHFNESLFDDAWPAF